MMCVTSVDPYWLAELGGVFFSIRERNFDGLQRARAAQEFNQKTEILARMAEQREEYVSHATSADDQDGAQEGRGDARRGRRAHAPDRRGGRHAARARHTEECGDRRGGAVESGWSDAQAAWRRDLIMLGPLG